jgi:hypothetical protein
MKSWVYLNNFADQDTIEKGAVDLIAIAMAARNPAPTFPGLGGVSSSP